jgi:primary-amine oxidase
MACEETPFELGWKLDNIPNPPAAPMYNRSQDSPRSGANVRVRSIMPHSHPLEPLSAVEVERAVSLLRTLPEFTASTRVISIMLKEPSKHVVHAWPDIEMPDREAEAVLHDNGRNACFHVDMNLATGAVAAPRYAPPGSQPTMSIDEQVECEQAVLKSQEFRAALKKHYGTDDTSLVMVDIWSAGNYGTEEDRTRRLARPLCFMRKDRTDNGYVRPIEGIRPVVDLNIMKVIRVEEYGVWPLPPKSGNYAATRVPNQRRDIKPLTIAQPEGPSFMLQGNRMNWQNWNFVIGFNPREGLTLHHIRYKDQGRERSILYRLRSPRWWCRTVIRAHSRPERTRLTWASTAWACAPTAWCSAAIAWGTSPISMQIFATAAGTR